MTNKFFSTSGARHAKIWLDNMRAPEGGDMNMKVIDLTHTIRPDMPVYPGTEPPQFLPANSYEKDGFKETTGNGNKMILLEPRAFSESQQIADYLKARNTVVVNLKRVTPAKRIIDFLSGTLYAISGTLQKLGNGIFLCTPNNVSVEGKMTEGEKPKVKKEEENKENNEYEW